MSSFCSSQKTRIRHIVIFKDPSLQRGLSSSRETSLPQIRRMFTMSSPSSVEKKEPRDFFFLFVRSFVRSSTRIDSRAREK